MFVPSGGSIRLTKQFYLVSGLKFNQHAAYVVLYVQTQKKEHKSSTELPACMTTCFVQGRYDLRENMPASAYQTEVKKSITQQLNILRHAKLFQLQEGELNNQPPRANSHLFMLWTGSSPTMHPSPRLAISSARLRKL